MTSDTENLEQRVTEHPFLKGMDKRHIKVLMQSAMPTRFETDQVIFRAGEPANGFYLIESGTVVLEVWVSGHGPITTDTVSAGEPLGWSWLFPPYLWHFDTRATEPTTAIFFDTAVLRQHYDEDLTLAHELFKRASQVMVQRLQTARRKLIEATKKSKPPGQ